MALSSGHTLSLNALAGATGNTQNSNVSLGGIEGSPTAGENISLSSYALGGSGVTSGGVGEISSGYTYLVENTSENYQLGFSDPGTRFATIYNRPANFTWSVTSGNKISLTTNSGRIATFTAGNMTDSTTQTTLQSVIAHNIRVVFADGYNDHATNYGVARNKAVYSVDSYDGNATALCLASNTQVALADNSSIEIGDLEEGMKLKGFRLPNLSEDINMLDWSHDSQLEPEEVEVEVLNLVFSFADRVYDINNGEIVASAEHPLLVNSNGVRKFKTIHTIEVGDMLVREMGDEVEVTSIDIKDETTEIVSLDVSGPDTYLANGYITHNKGGYSHTDLGNPGAPTSLAYTSVDNDNKNITWSAGTSSGDTGVTAYDVQVDNNSDFSSPVLNFSEYSSTTLNITALATGTYYARVRAIDHGLKSGWTSTLTISHTQGVGH